MNHADAPNMLHRLARVSMSMVLVAAGLRWIVDSNPWSGPVIIYFTRSHGVHLNDWLTFVLWYASILVARPQWARLVIPLPIRLRERDHTGAVVGHRLRLIESVPLRGDLQSVHLDGPTASGEAATTVAA